MVDHALAEKWDVLGAHDPAAGRQRVPLLCFGNMNIDLISMVTAQCASEASESDLHNDLTGPERGWYAQQAVGQVILF